MQAPARAALLAVSAATVIAMACAQPGAPPGGPPDEELPVLLKVIPDSNTVNVRTPAVVLQFDEVISERSAAGGAQAPAGGNALNSVLLLSPSDGRDEVIWRRTGLELRPRRGFRPNTTYRVTIMPGLADIRGNRTSEAFEYVFSTGATPATGEVRGVFFDWTTGRAAPNARVDLFRDGDSTFRWSARTDSSGSFRVRDLNPGSYEVRAWVDGNNDRRISFREISDSARVELSDTASLELYAFVRDTIPPRIENVDVLDSTGIRVRFDRGIVASWDGLGAVLLNADSVEIPLAGPFVPATQFDSLARARKAVSDSAAKAAGDTSAIDTPAPGAGVTRSNAPGAAPPAATQQADADAEAAADTSVQSPKFNRAVPVTAWSAPLAAPLAPGTYRLRVQRAAGLNGRAVNAIRELRVSAPPPPAPADSAKAPADSARTPVPARRP